MENIKIITELYSGEVNKIKDNTCKQKAQNTPLSLRAFTLAEVLITLAIIGVVAALTIPSVIANYNDKRFNTARLKALHTFGDAGRMISVNNQINGQVNAKAFVNNVLSKNLRVTRVCDTAAECEFPKKIQPSNPASAPLVSDDLKKWNEIGENAYDDLNLSPMDDPSMSTYITTADGFSAKVFYNPNCVSDPREAPMHECLKGECISLANDVACLNVIYDMNGKNSPNQAGYDIGFVTTFWSGMRAISVAPGMLPYNTAKAISGTRAKKWSEAQITCASNGTTKTPYTLANVYELQSLMLNVNISSAPTTSCWSGSPVPGSPNYAWVVDYDGGMKAYGRITNLNSAWCVRR